MIKTSYEEEKEFSKKNPEDELVHQEQMVRFWFGCDYERTFKDVLNLIYSARWLKKLQEEVKNRNLFCSASPTFYEVADAMEILYDLSPSFHAIFFATSSEVERRILVCAEICNQSGLLSRKKELLEEEKKTFSKMVANSQEKIDADIKSIESHLLLICNKNFFKRKVLSLIRSRPINFLKKACSFSYGVFERNIFFRLGLQCVFSLDECIKGFSFGRYLKEKYSAIKSYFRGEESGDDTCDSFEKNDENKEKTFGAKIAAVIENSYLDIFSKGLGIYFFTLSCRLFGFSSLLYSTLIDLGTDALMHGGWRLVHFGKSLGFDEKKVLSNIPKIVTVFIFLGARGYDFCSGVNFSVISVRTVAYWLGLFGGEYLGKEVFLRLFRKFGVAVKYNVETIKFVTMLSGFLGHILILKCGVFLLKNRGHSISNVSFSDEELLDKLTKNDRTASAICLNDKQACYGKIMDKLANMTGIEMSSSGNNGKRVRNLTLHELKDLKRAGAFSFHPDRGGDSEKFKFFFSLVDVAKSLEDKDPGLKLSKI